MADYKPSSNDISPMGEVWLAIPDYERVYEASNLGNIRSLDRWLGKRLIKGRVIKPSPDGRGYLQFQLCRNNARKMMKVHKVVATLFCNPNGKAEVNHKNFDKLNNQAINLEWVTRQENVAHYKATGGFTSAVNPSRKQKLSMDDANAIRTAKKQGRSLVDLSELFGVSKVHIFNICRNKYHANSVGVNNG
jgi:hypothetical protein